MFIVILLKFKIYETYGRIGIKLDGLHFIIADKG